MTSTKTAFTPRTNRKGTEIERDVARMSAKAATHVVDMVGDGDFVVGSGHSGEIYEVTVSQISSVMEGATRPTLVCTCTCEYGQNMGEGCACSHTIAAVARHLGGRLKLYNSPSSAGRSHRAVAYIGDGVWASPR